MIQAKHFTQAVDTWRAEARRKRRDIFLSQFSISPSTRILDLGSEDGRHIANLLKGTLANPSCVYIADIDKDAVAQGRQNYGFVPVVLKELEPLPFPDQFFDIVYCSSVIEHVTVPKETMWDIVSEQEFLLQATANQERFAREIRRVAKAYFVQTPWIGFPVESHSWLPFLGFLPRQLQIPIIRVANRVWIKGTVPDFRLLTIKQMRQLFPEARVVNERVYGITKSLMAIKSNVQ